MTIFIESTFQQKITLAASGVSFVFFAIALDKERFKLSLAFLILGGFLLNMFTAGLDPFLNDWDERFHALVAKSILVNPFAPTLFSDHPLPYDFQNWTDNKIWLHKQPLFLWQIGLSYLLFGVSEFTLRIPSVVMATLLIPVLYRIGKLIADEHSGLVTAFLYATSFYHLEMIAGVHGMEHNTFAFVFYVTLSVWAWIEYMNQPTMKWVLVIGIFCAAAVLNKWLTGLWIYGVWGTAILIDKEKVCSWKSYRDIVVSFLTACLLFMPWQIYTLYFFPKESNHEFLVNSLHLTQVIEEHFGNVWFYIQHLPLHYGSIFAWLLIPALILMVFYAREKKVVIALICGLLVVFGFFSIMVASKLNHYTYMVMCIAFLSLGMLFSRLLKTLSRISGKASLIFIFVSLILLGKQSLRAKELNCNHSLWCWHFFGEENYRLKKIHNTNLYKSLPKLIGKKDSVVVLNCKIFTNTELMFYSGLRGYAYIPDSIVIEQLKVDGWKVAVFENEKVPSFMREDSAIFKIKELWQ